MNRIIKSIDAVDSNVYSMVDANGRVFYDLTELVRIQREILLEEELDAIAANDRISQVHIAGMNDLLDHIEQSIENLREHAQ